MAAPQMDQVNARMGDLDDLDEAKGSFGGSAGGSLETYRYI